MWATATSYEPISRTGIPGRVAKDYSPGQMGITTKTKQL